MLSVLESYWNYRKNLLMVCAFCVRRLLIDLRLLGGMLLQFCGRQTWSRLTFIGKHVTAVLRKTDMVAALNGLSIVWSFSVRVLLKLRSRLPLEFSTVRQRRRWRLWQRLSYTEIVDRDRDRHSRKMCCLHLFGCFRGEVKWIFEPMFLSSFRSLKADLPRGVVRFYLIVTIK